MTEDAREALGAHAKSEHIDDQSPAAPAVRGAHMRVAASQDDDSPTRIVPPTARFVPSHAAVSAPEVQASFEESVSADVADAPQGGPDPAPTPLEPAPTATFFYANACERAAAAERNLRDQDLAMSSLAGQASATYVLPTGSRAVSGTQEFPDTLRQALDEADAKASAARATSGEQAGQLWFDEEPKRHGTVWRRVLIGAAVALALVAGAAAVAFFVLDVPSWFQEVDQADVERALERDETFMAGFAANDYVTPSAYTLSDVQIDAVGSGEDGSKTVSAAAVLTNESFESEATATILFVRAGDAANYAQFADVSSEGLERNDWVGVVTESSAVTRAVAGVTNDPELGASFAPTFDEASQTCTYTAEGSTDLWFAVRTTATAYTYTFDGNAWQRSVGEPQSALAYNAKALAGEYAPQDSGASRMDAFRITNVDAQAGTFTVEYQVTPSGFGNDPITGVITCTISVMDASDAGRGYAQADGFAYAFSGDGSSSGGGNTAHIEGFLGLDGALVFDFTGDYTRMPFLFGDPTNETMQVAGTVVKA